jgi:hypothetical protein
MIYYFISGSSSGGLSIYGVSLTTGLVVSQGTISNAGSLYFDMMRIQSDCYESRPTRLAPSSNMDETLTSANKVNVFPNPFTDQITISSEAELQKTELIQANGQVVKSVPVSGKEITFETSQLINGIYFLHVTNVEGMEIIKIIK